MRTGGRAPPSSNLHITVAFVGDVAPARVAGLCAIGAAVASNVPAFDLTLKVHATPGQALFLITQTADAAEITLKLKALGAVAPFRPSTSSVYMPAWV